MESKQLRYNGIKRRDFIITDSRDNTIRQFKTYREFDAYRKKYGKEQINFDFKEKDYK